MVSIKTDCREIFPINEKELAIIEKIARDGEMYRKDISLGRVQKKQTARVVERLAGKKFLHITESKLYRNMKGKYVKKFGLTLKGTLASATKVNTADNYLVKTYLNEIKDTKLRLAVSNYIKSDISIFFRLNRVLGLIIVNVPDMVQWKETCDRLIPMYRTELSESYKERLEKSKIVEEKLKKLDRKEKKKNEFAKYYKKWYRIIELLSKKKKIKQYSKRYNKLHSFEGEQFFEKFNELFTTMSMLEKK